MAGIYSPKNVGKLIFGGPEAAEVTSKTFRSAASAGELKILSADGTDVASGVNFKVFSKNADGTLNVSDTIDPNKVVKVSVKEYEAEVPKEVTATFGGAVRDGATYRVSIRKYDHIQSPENFRHVHAFYVTSDTATADGETIANIIDELDANLQTALERENSQSEFTISNTATTLVITAKNQTYVQGKKQGDQIQFDIESSVKPNAYDTLATPNFNGDITTAITQAPNPGSGTGKGVANLEYFLNGYETTDYGREVGYPANFDFSPNASSAGLYNSVQLAFYSEREYTNVERQHKELTVVFDTVDALPASNADTNAFLQQLRDAGVSGVPADLAVV